MPVIDSGIVKAFSAVSFSFRDFGMTFTRMAPPDTADTVRTSVRSAISEFEFSKHSRCSSLEILCLESRSVDAHGHDDVAKIGRGCFGDRLPLRRAVGIIEQ